VTLRAPEVTLRAPEVTVGVRRLGRPPSEASARQRLRSRIVQLARLSHGCVHRLGRMTPLAANCAPAPPTA
jgi:hypothetical protein